MSNIRRPCFGKENPLTLKIGFGSKVADSQSENGQSVKSGDNALLKW